MQIHAPDPAYTGSERARANFRLAVKIALGFVALLWVIQLSNWALDLGPAEFGVRPRQLAGLPGILVAPLMHGGFGHLIANSPPLAVLGTAMLYLYPRSALRVLPAVYLGPGIAVWLFAQGSSHVGASGLVYGLVGYIFVAGLIRRGLVEEGHAADVAPNGEDALWMADAHPYDVIVLDVMLPGLSGFETCRRLRNAGERLAVGRVDRVPAQEDSGLLAFGGLPLDVG